MARIKIQIASVPDRDQLVAEIWADGLLCAEVTQEGAVFFIELYQANLKLPFTEFIAVLDEAKKRLTEGGMNC